MQDFKYTGTNPYDLMQQSRAGRVETPTPSTTPATETAAPVDPNQDLYNELMGMSQQRILTDRLAGLDEQQQVTSQTYSQMYQDLLRNQRMQRGLSDTRGFSGGMADQYSEKLGAAQIAALGQVGMGREAATRDIQSQRRMAPFESALQAGQIQQFATSLDPRRQQLNTLADIGATQQWAELYNQIYPGSNLQFNATTGTFTGGGAGSPVMGNTGAQTVGGFNQVVNPVSNRVTNLGREGSETSFVKTDAMTPEEVELKRDEIIAGSLGLALSPKQRENFKEYFGEKEDYTNEIATIEAYYSNQLPFDKWSEIDKEVFGGSGAQTEYLLQVGAQPFQGPDGTTKIYFQDSSNPFLGYLIAKYRDSGKWSQVPEIAANTVPGRNAFDLTPEQVAKDIEEYLGVS